jgi:hypothetical protein
MANLFLIAALSSPSNTSEKFASKIEATIFTKPAMNLSNSLTSSFAFLIHSKCDVETFGGQNYSTSSMVEK